MLRKFGGSRGAIFLILATIATVGAYIVVIPMWLILLYASANDIDLFRQIIAIGVLMFLVPTGLLAVITLVLELIKWIKRLR